MVANGVFINAIDNNSTILTIPSIKIGPVTATNLTPFTNLNVTTGVRYNLILNIVPADAFITHLGRPAARINGMIWARHNLATNSTVDPHLLPLTLNRTGDYHQWGTRNRSGDGIATTANPFLASNNPAINAWNSGTQDAPIKTLLDPCPTGYRVPTSPEFTALLSSTNGTNVGNFSSANQYGSGRVLTSKTNPTVKLTFPAQGKLEVSGSSRPMTNIGIRERGTHGYYHTSRAYGNDGLIWYTYNSSATSGSAFVGSTDIANKIRSYPIRCIAE